MYNWIKNHKLSALLIVVVLFFVLVPLARNIFGVNFTTYAPASTNMGASDMAFSRTEAGIAMAPSGALSLPSVLYSGGGGAPQVEKNSRMVVQNSNLSLLVKDVREAGGNIIGYAESKGGFMVETSYSRPEESPLGYISVRVPTASLNEALEYIRSQSIKVTNENLLGKDVTEQYINVEERIAALEKIKSRYESLLDNTSNVNELLNLQREIINTQTQIDNLLGQKKALEDNANFTKITIYLSTDELSLPYTPDNKFRPGVVFKLAVRSMLGTLQWLGEMAIWVFVYSVVWVPVVLVFILYKKFKKKQTLKNSPQT